MIGDIPMRKPEHRILETDVMSAILDNTEFVTIGVNDGDYPYMVPVTFGYEFRDEKLYIYVHCAREGHKADLWRSTGRVTCVFTMFQNHPHISYRGGIHDYRCIMANGTIRELDPRKDGGVWGRAFQSILKHSHRKPNEFSVPHYGFMTQFMIECSMKHVSAKSEYAVYSPEDVPFPTLEELIFNGEDLTNKVDDTLRLVRKDYTAAAEGCASVPAAGPLTAAALTADKVSVEARWRAPADGSYDADLYAVMRTADGRVKRRYSLAWYKQLWDIDHAVCHTGDDILNTAGCEGLNIEFPKLSEDVEEILLVLAVHNAEERGQDLGAMGAVTFDVRDTEQGTPLARGSVDVQGTGKPAAVYACFTKTGNGWEFKASPMLLDKWDIRSVALALGLKKWKE